MRLCHMTQGHQQSCRGQCKVAAMPTPNSAPLERQKFKATGLGAAAALLTSGTVSWLTTPDGNLVVTLVPGLTVGLATYFFTRWVQRRRAG